MNEINDIDKEYPIRVGTAISVGKGKYHYEEYRSPNGVLYENIIVLMKSHSKWFPLGPYNLKDDQNRIFENVWQGSKIYPHVPEHTQYYNPYTKDVISWQHPQEIHIDQETQEPTKEYWKWREKLMNNEHYVRWPVPKTHTKLCAYAIPESDTNRKLGYIVARKTIYGPLYVELVRKEKLYEELCDKLKKGVRLNIIEVDGPQISSLQYYIDTYNVSDNWIENYSIAATRQNLDIMLHDKKHPFGHGYCLAIALQNMDTLFNKRIVKLPNKKPVVKKSLPVIDITKLKIKIIPELTKTLVDTGKSQLNIYFMPNTSVLFVRHCVEEIEKNESLIYHPPLGKMYGKDTFQQRSVGFYSNSSEGYRYSRQIMMSQPLTQLLQIMLSSVNEIFKANFNGILVNKYDGGDEYVSYHSDNEQDLEPNAGVVAISYGIPRYFCVKHNETGKVTKIATDNQEIIQMAGDFQKEFKHSIIKQKNLEGIRYSFTFRCHNK